MGDYGLPPAQSSFAMHATIVEHYLNGAFYPIGGAASIAAAMVPLIEKLEATSLPAPRSPASSSSAVAPPEFA